MEQHGRHPSPQSLHALDWLNLFLADVRTGVGPFLAIYLASAPCSGIQRALASRCRR